jgi:hypothetical protein
MKTDIEALAQLNLQIGKLESGGDRSGLNEWPIPADPSDDAGDEGGISDWVSLDLQATDPKSHTLVRNSYTRFFSLPLPDNSDGRTPGTPREALIDDLSGAQTPTA